METIKKIFNPLYLVALILAYFLYSYSQKSTESSEMFFGFAENKETEINLDYPVKVDKIMVKPGDFIEAGTQLAELTQITLSKEINDEQLRINELTSEFMTKKNDIESEISVLQSEMNQELKEIDAEIEKLKSERKFKESLSSGLKTIDIKPGLESQKVFDTELKTLNEKKDLIKSNYGTKISSKNLRIEDEKGIYNSAVKRHNSDVGFAEEKMKKLDLKSPSNALVGNVHIKEGEYIQSFKTMVTLYEPNPTLVAGFVHESMIVDVEVGDKFFIRSALNQDHRCTGVVTGMGSRIVEIPERLRKMPELKTYGREVLIAIPADNKFLQKEKVIISLENPDEQDKSSTAQTTSK